MAVACFNKLSFSTQTAWLFAPDKLLYWKILWALPKPAIFEKLSKLFCFWEDNLALAEFQCPTDTPLNHNFKFKHNKTAQWHKRSMSGLYFFKRNIFLF